MTAREGGVVQAAAWRRFFFGKVSSNSLIFCGGRRGAGTTRAGLRGRGGGQHATLQRRGANFDVHRGAELLGRLTHDDRLGDALDRVLLGKERGVELGRERRG